jgi:predicted enzyme related to lactoylglutathione lyase
MLRTGQVAVYVDDLDQAIKDFEYVFGIKFRMVEADFIQQRVAVSDFGLVLSTRANPEVPSNIENNFTGRLTAIEVQVDNLDETRRRMEELGSKLIYSMDSESGFHEHYMEKGGFHGIPLTLFEISGESWVEAIGAADDEAPQPTVTWAEGQG